MPKNIPPEEKKTEEPVNVIEKCTNDLYKDLENILGDGSLTPINFATTCISLMQNVESFTNLRGLEKKDVILRVFEKYIAEEQPDDIVLNIIPSFIDAMISVDRGEISIKIKPEKCLAACFGCVSSKGKNKRK